MRGWTQEEIAEALGTGRGTIYRDATIARVGNSCILDQRYKLKPAQVADWQHSCYRASGRPGVKVKERQETSTLERMF